MIRLRTFFKIYEVFFRGLPFWVCFGFFFLFCFYFFCFYLSPDLTGTTDLTGTNSRFKNRGIQTNGRKNAEESRGQSGESRGQKVFGIGPQCDTKHQQWIAYREPKRGNLQKRRECKISTNYTSYYLQKISLLFTKTCIYSV